MLKIENLVLYKKHFRTYNPSIFYVKNKEYHVYRFSNYSFCNTKLDEDYISYIYIYNVSSKSIKVVQLPDYMQKCKPTAYGMEDPRSVFHEGELMIFANKQSGIECQNEMYMLIISIDSIENHYDVVVPLKVIKLTIKDFYKGGVKPAEKNWMPFISKNKLYFVYSIYPTYKVLCYNKDKKECVLVHSEKFNMKSEDFLSRSLNYRGGTNLIPYKDYFLGCIHTRELFTTYYSYFILLENKFPFSIVKISSPFTLGDTKTGIEFLSGILINKSKDIIISYGVDDCKSKLATVKEKHFLKYMGFF
jgi:predicted GH43/DUF377 family glycosyl hydrolase